MREQLKVRRRGLKRHDRLGRRPHRVDAKGWTGWRGLKQRFREIRRHIQARAAAALGITFGHELVHRRNHGRARYRQFSRQLPAARQLRTRPDSSFKNEPAKRARELDAQRLRSSTLEAYAEDRSIRRTPSGLLANA